MDEISSAKNFCFSPLNSISYKYFQARMTKKNSDLALVHADHNIQIVKMARMMADLQNQDEIRRKSMKHKNSQTVTPKPDVPDKKVVKANMTKVSASKLLGMSFSM